MGTSYFICSLICHWTPGRLPLLPVMHDAPAVPTHLFQSPIPITWGVWPWGADVAASHDSSARNFLEDCYAISQSEHTILHSHQQWTKFSVSPHRLQKSLFSGLFVSSYGGHPDGREVVSLWFDRHFSDDQ